VDVSHTTPARGAFRALLIASCLAIAASWCAAWAATAQDEGSAPADHAASAPMRGEFLTIGDTAPTLDVAHWLKGREVEAFEPGRIYVINFWTTWCKFCRAEIPALGELQREFETDGVRVVALSHERLQTVYRFLSRGCWDEKAVFTIAVDSDRSAVKDYMAAAAVNSVPSAFVVGRDGCIEWIGHPSGLADVLRAVVGDTWDRVAAREKFEAAMTDAYERARHFRKVREAYHAEDWDLLLELFDEAISRAEKPGEIKVQRFLVMIGGMNQPEAGYAYGRELLSEYWDDANVLNQLAWFVVESESVATRDLEFCMKAARRACDLTDWENASIVDTFARICYETGDLDAALKWQRVAVNDLLLEDDPFYDTITEALERYEGESREPPGK